VFQGVTTAKKCMTGPRLPCQLSIVVFTLPFAFAAFLQAQAPDNNMKKEQAKLYADAHP